MRSSSSSRVVGSLITSCVCGYTGYIEYNNRLFQIGENSRGNFALSFGVGSADDILSDYLRPGDVVLFKRQWYQHHLPMAACIKIYQWLHPDGDFDHCGVITGTDKEGMPLVWELSPHGKPTVRPFSQCILQSKAQQIMLKPLSPRIEFTAEQLQHTATAARMSTSIISPTTVSSGTAEVTRIDNASSTSTKGTAHIVQHSEFTAMLLGFMTPSIRRIRSFLSVVGIITAPQVNTSDSYPGMGECPNTQLVLTCWKHLDIRPPISEVLSENEITNLSNTEPTTMSTSLATATCRDLSNGANTLHLGYYPPGTKQPTPVNLSGDILIRTR